MNYSIQELLVAVRPKNLSSSFLNEFLNGDCRVFSDIVGWNCEDASLKYAIIVMENFEFGFCHSFVEIDVGDAVVLVDCRGVFSTFSEFLNEIIADARERNVIENQYVDGDVIRYQIDDIQFAEYLYKSDKFKQLQRIESSENLNEAFFQFQLEAFQYLLDRCYNKPVQAISSHVMWNTNH